jgi:hypothetical protein
VTRSRTSAARTTELDHPSAPAHGQQVRRAIERRPSARRATPERLGAGATEPVARAWRWRVAVCGPSYAA